MRRLSDACLGGGEQIRIDFGRAAVNGRGLYGRDLVGTQRARPRVEGRPPFVDCLLGRPGSTRRQDASWRVSKIGVVRVQINDYGCGSIGFGYDLHRQ